MFKKNCRLARLVSLFAVYILVSPSGGISTLPWRCVLWVPGTLRVKPAVALLQVGSAKPDSSRGQETDGESCLGGGKSDTNPSDAGSSDSSNDLKHRANNSRDGSWSWLDGMNGSGTAMWKANGKTVTLLLFMDNLFPKKRDKCEMLSLKTKKIRREIPPPFGSAVRGGNGTQNVSRWDHKFAAS